MIRAAEYGRDVDGGGWRWKGRWDGADENIGPWRRDWQVGLRAGGGAQSSQNCLGT